ncbi:hypothetical protein, partial [Klebsiella pneumoniae]|uniref:hypothetical protein n=1 Tax=Klebsiella pneumoniae TaxID=573 RepID=UPI002730A421
PDVFGDYADADIDFSEFPQSVTAYSTIDDVNYGVPFDSGTAVSALRTDVLEQAGVDEIKVRTPLTCGTRFGLCAKCYGRDLGRGGL